MCYTFLYGEIRRQFLHFFWGLQVLFLPVLKFSNLQLGVLMPPIVSITFCVAGLGAGCWVLASREQKYHNQPLGTVRRSSGLWVVRAWWYLGLVTVELQDGSLRGLYNVYQTSAIGVLPTVWRWGWRWRWRWSGIYYYCYYWLAADCLFVFLLSNLASHSL